jgi:hypothetical protein
MTSVKIDKVFLGDCDARLLPVLGGYIAEIHSEHPRPRQNFSICHEIAHTFFAHQDETDSFSSFMCSDLYSESHWLEERLCNLAAVELLMPEVTFQPIGSRLTPSLGSIGAIAGIYDTSLQTTALRIIDLDLWPCAFLCIQPVTVLDAPLEFAIKSWRASKSLSGKFGSHDLVSSLRYKLRSRFDDRLGFEETWLTGRQTTRQVSSRGASFSLQSYKSGQNGHSSIACLIF